MKLASYKDGSRDGQLIVVSRDLSQAHFASGIANRMQQVLDDWNFFSPQLQDIYDALNSGRARQAFALDPGLCLSPLPRAYNMRCVTWLDVDAQQHEEFVQCASDFLHGPLATWQIPESINDLSCDAGIAVICADIPSQCTSERALDGIRLFTLAQRLSTGSGQGKTELGLALACVAVTPDELGDAWSRSKLNLPLLASVNGRKLAALEPPKRTGSGMGQLLAKAVRNQPLRAGAILANLQPVFDGLKAGDSFRLEIKNADGQSIFGAIVQEMAGRPAAGN